MQNFFNDIVQQLITGKIDNPRLEARLLIGAVTKKGSSQVFSDIQLTESQIKKLQELTSQRLAHKPLDKILGHRAFYKTDFTVNEDVLSPRPDTEIMVEKALQYMPKDAENILDLGTGSGCIIESILLEKINLSGTAVDLSAAALNVARNNAEKLGLKTRLRFVNANWFAADVVKKIGQKFDMIVSNPPYIPSGDISALAPEVKNHDPIVALDGGKDGMKSYHRIAEIVPELLNDGGFILLEAGIGQASMISAIFTQCGLQHIETANDLNGIARCVILQKEVAKSKKS